MPTEKTTPVNRTIGRSSILPRIACVQAGAEGGFIGILPMGFGDASRAKRRPEPLKGAADCTLGREPEDLSPRTADLGLSSQATGMTPATRARTLRSCLGPGARAPGYKNGARYAGYPDDMQALSRRFPLAVESARRP